MNNINIQKILIFFKKFIYLFDIISVIGIASGLLLFSLSPLVGKFILIFFCCLAALYHFTIWGFMGRFDEQKLVLEKFITTMIGFAAGLIIIGGMAKYMGWGENDKLLNLGLAISILISAILSLYRLLQSHQLKPSQVPYIRNILICIAGIVIFELPFHPLSPNKPPFPVAPNTPTETIIKTSKKTLNKTQINTDHANEDSTP